MPQGKLIASKLLCIFSKIFEPKLHDRESQLVEWKHEALYMALDT